jgi:hypothetical protein
MYRPNGVRQAHFRLQAQVSSKPPETVSEQALPDEVTSEVPQTGMEA